MASRPENSRGMPRLFLTGMVSDIIVRFPTTAPGRFWNPHFGSAHFFAPTSLLCGGFVPRPGSPGRPEVAVRFLPSKLL